MLHRITTPGEPRFSSPLNRSVKDDSPPTSTPVAAATTNVSIAKADSRKPVKKDEVSKFQPELETEPRKFELVVVWLFLAVLLILTVVAGYVLWKKVSLTS
jgi:hypothetical protein